MQQKPCTPAALRYTWLGFLWLDVYFGCPGPTQDSVKLPVLMVSCTVPEGGHKQYDHL